jgi:streptogramin lyase
MRSRSVTIGLLTVLVALAGCGGSGATQSTPAASTLPTVTIDARDLERIPAADLADRLTVIEVPDAREPEIGNSLESMAVSDDAVWVVSHRGGIVAHIDPTTNRVVAAIESPIDPDCRPNACTGLGGIAAVGPHVWLHNQYSETLKRIDASADEIVGTIAAADLNGLLAADGLIWTGLDGDDGAVGRDPASGDVRVTVAEGIGLAPAGMAAGSVWFVGAECRELLRVDPATGDVQAAIPIDACLGNLVDVGTEVWAATAKGILRLDPESDEPVGWIRIQTDHERVSLAVDGDSVWFRGRVTEILRIDPATHEAVERIGLPPGQYQAEIGVVDGSLWVANWGEGTVYRIEN